MKKVLGLIAVTVVLAAGTLLAIEGLASLTKAGNASLYVEDPELWVLRKPGTDGYTFGDARWIAVHINRQGLRGDELPEARDPAEVRVLCVGDSFTFGGGVETQEAWPQQVQAMLGPPEQSHVRVLNGGANGWDTRWQRLYLEKRGVASLDPDVVVLGFNWNDFDMEIDSGQQAIDNFITCKNSKVLSLFAGSPFLRETHLYRWLYCWQKGTGDVPTDDTQREWFKEYRERRDRQTIEPEQRLAKMKQARFGTARPDNRFFEFTDDGQWKMIRAELTAMAAFLASKGIPLMVALLPDPTWKGPGTYPGVDRMTALLDHLNVPWVDLQPDFLLPGDGETIGKTDGLWQRYDFSHPSARGQRLIAQRCAEALRAHALLKRRS